MLELYTVLSVILVYDLILISGNKSCPNDMKVVDNL